MFSILLKANFSFLAIFFLSSAIAFNLDKSKILLFGKELTLYQTIPTFKDPGKKLFKNIEGKVESTGSLHCLLFPQCFKPYQRQK